jgi:hypothetical protein
MLWGRHSGALTEPRKDRARASVKAACSSRANEHRGRSQAAEWFIHTTMASSQSWYLSHSSCMRWRTARATLLLMPGRLKKRAQEGPGGRGGERGCSP